jgi:hypothetical protein
MVAPVNGATTAPDSGYTPGKKNSELQGHVAFFDRDHDGIIWPSDTSVQLNYFEIRKTGLNLIFTQLQGNERNTFQLILDDYRCGCYPHRVFVHNMGKLDP